MDNPSPIETAPAAGSTYDETPYPSTSFPQTHPDKLAAMGRFFGLPTTGPSKARVLELGCADGANLLPMAQHMPGATFVGIDASAKQVEVGREAIAAVGLKNIEIRHQDILDFPATEGKFDYIIAHGIFSWVPDLVKEKILTICRDNLGENGVAFVSYNAYPGWGMRMALRDMMFIHTGGLTDPKEKVRQARALVTFLAESVPVEDNPYGMLLKQEAERMKTYSDNYLRHDILEEINQPFYFHEFMSRAGKAGLQYLSEPSIHQMLASNFPQKVQDTLAKLGNNMVAREQYMDFLRNRTFRQTLLVHQEAKLNRQVAPGMIKELLYTGSLDLPNGEIDFTAGVAQHFGIRGTKSSINATDSFVKGAFSALARAGFNRVSYDELLAAGRAGGPTKGAPTEPDKMAAFEEVVLLQNLMQLLSRGLIEIFAERPTVSREVPDKPQVSPLARYQARHGRQITGRFHNAINVDAMARHIMAACDGKNDRAAIVDSLLAATKSGALRATEHEKPLDDEARLRAAYLERLNTVLPRLANYGFFPS